MFAASKEQSNWNPQFFEQGGLFDVFKPWTEWFLHYRTSFPDLQTLSELASTSPVASVVSGGGFPIRFAKQQRIMRCRRADLGWRANYQMRIFLSGSVPTRLCNWHDFFNAWTWIYLPKLKAAINARHFHCIEENSDFPWSVVGGGNRNREQDLLTLFDEGGLLVVTEDDELWQMIVERRWSDLFVENSVKLKRAVRFIPVGHALFECALNGHPKLHASCIRVRENAEKLKFDTPVGWFHSLAKIDETAALKISRRTLLRSPEDLHALPIWGIPGWHPRSGDPVFIADRTHFR